MARPKSKGELRTFIFSVDANDPKYSALVEYLENIDNGARSYVIRQILNSYICEQKTEVFVDKSVPEVKTEEVIEQKTIKEKVENTNVTPPIQTRKSSFKNKMNSNTTQQSKNEEKAKEEAIVPSEGMSKLLNNFM